MEGMRRDLLLAGGAFLRPVPQAGRGRPGDARGRAARALGRVGQAAPRVGRQRPRRGGLRPGPASASTGPATSGKRAVVAMELANLRGDAGMFRDVIGRPDGPATRRGRTAEVALLLADRAPGGLAVVLANGGDRAAGAGAVDRRRGAAAAGDRRRGPARAGPGAGVAGRSCAAKAGRGRGPAAAGRGAADAGGALSDLTARRPPRDGPDP